MTDGPRATATSRQTGARASGPARVTGALRRWVIEAGTRRLGYKFAAVFFALVLWLVASVEEPTEELVPVRLTTAVDSSLAIVGERPMLHALVVGRSRELIKLFDRPPVIRRAFGAGTPERVRLQIRPADVDLPPGVEATVRDVQPRSVVLQFAVVRPRGPRETARGVSTLGDSTDALGEPPIVLADSLPIAIEGVPVTDSTPAEATRVDAPPAGTATRTTERARGAPPEPRDTAAPAKTRNPAAAPRTDSVRRPRPPR